MPLIVMYLIYFYPALIFAPVYLFIRIKFNLSFKWLQIIRITSGCIFGSVGVINLFFDALNSGPGALIIIYVIIPPYSSFMYLLGIITILILEHFTYLYYRKKNVPFLTKDEVSQKSGLLIFGLITIVLGVTIPLILFVIRSLFSLMFYFKTQ